MKFFVSAMMLLSGLALAQEKPAGPPQKELVPKVIPVKYADVNAVARALVGFGNIRAEPSARYLIVQGSPEMVAALEEAVKRLDIAPKPGLDVELTLYLIAASSQDTPVNPGEEPPKDLESTIKQLRGVFSYKNYRLVETLITRAQNEREIQMSGMLPKLGLGGSYNFSTRVFVTDSTPRSLRLQNLKLQLQERNSGASSGITTDLDAKEGQKVVVGKSSLTGSVEAVFLIVVPKVVE